MKSFIIFPLLLLGVTSNEPLRNLQISPLVAFQDWFHGGNTKTVFATSEIHCGMMASKLSCITYDYQDKVCAMEGCGDFKRHNGGEVTATYFMKLVNVAKHKQTYNIDSYPDGQGSRAVDDDTCTDAPNCGLSTYKQANPWFVVDLGSPQKIFVVDITPCLVGGLSHVEIKVGQHLEKSGNFSSYEMFESLLDFNEAHRYLFSKPGGIVARFVSVQRMTIANFYLCGIEVLVPSN